MNQLQKILSFINDAEKLKCEMRHSWLSNGRQESVAEHTWRMSLMALLLHKEIASSVDILKTLKMIIIHDLVEIEAGDIPAMESIRNPEIKELKQKKELKAIENIQSKLKASIGDEIYSLWMEFEGKETPEAKFANALDKLEVQIQHNQASLDTWEEFEYDMIYMMDKHVAFDNKLSEFKDLIVTDAEDLIKKSK